MAVEPTSNVGAFGTSEVFTGADTQKVCSPNSVIKYINFRLESGIRDVAPAAPGFVEYAIVVLEEQSAAPTLDASITAQIGTKTLGTICKNLYRGNCLWEGAFALSREIPGVLDLKMQISRTSHIQHPAGFL